MIVPQFTQRPLPDITQDTLDYNKIAKYNFSVVATKYNQQGYDLRFCGPTDNGEVHKLIYEKFIGDKCLLLNLQWSNKAPDEYLFGFFIIGKRSTALMMENKAYDDNIDAHALAFSEYANEAEVFLNKVSCFGNVGDPIKPGYQRQIKINNLEKEI